MFVLRITLNGCPTARAFCCWNIYFRQPTTAAKFIIKSLLFVLKFNNARQAETKDWLAFS
jgi:hypothetical protein